MAVVISEFRLNGETVGAVTASECSFKTGSRGYRGVGKLTMIGKKYQVSVQLVEIHSKGPAEDEPVETEEGD